MVRAIWMLLLLLAQPAVAETIYAPVLPGKPIVFPRDEGAHPAFRTEWWYITGWLQDEKGQAQGFQITFFRSRSGKGETNPSRFSPEQIIVAHAAISDPALGRLLHDQRMARQGFGLAFAEEGRMNLQLDHWKLFREGDRYLASIPTRSFLLELSLIPGQPPLLQGESGFSRKGSGPESGSHYYSLPHLQVKGTLSRGTNKQTITGIAWLDHEWSSHYLDKQAAGWDWVGLNMDDGGALMAFRMRSKAGGVLWAGATYRDKEGRVTLIPPHDILFEPSRRWTSPRSGTTYPVAMELRVGRISLQLEPLMEDQELDGRKTTSALYYEGAVLARQNGRVTGRGYLELTGYNRAMNF